MFASSTHSPIPGDIQQQIDSALEYLKIGLYHKVVDKIYDTLDILERRRNFVECIKVSLNFAQAFFNLYKIYLNDELCLHIINFCDNVFKISEKHSSPEIINQHREAAKIKFDTLVFLIGIYKEKQPEDAIALLKILAQLLRDKTYLLYSYPAEQLVLSFIPINSKFPYLNIVEEVKKFNMSFFIKNNLHIFHLYILNKIIGVLLSLKNKHSLASGYYFQAISVIVSYACKLENQGLLTPEIQAVFSEMDARDKKMFERCKINEINQRSAKNTVAPKPHELTFKPEVKNYPPEYLIGVRTVAHFILELKENPPIEKLAYEDFMRFTFVSLVEYIEEAIPKNLSAVQRSQIIRDKIPLIQQISELLPLYIDTNVAVLQDYLVKQIKAFESVVDESAYNKFIASLPIIKPKVSKPTLPRAPRNPPKPKEDDVKKPLEKTKIDIATVKKSIALEKIDLDETLNKIILSYTHYYPHSSANVIKIESIQVLSRSVYEIIYERYKEINWDNWAPTLNTLYIHAELQKQIIKHLQAMQRIVASIDEDELNKASEVPKDKSLLKTELSRVLHEMEESLTITKNNIIFMQEILDENKQRLQKEGKWRKNTHEPSEVAKEVNKIPEKLHEIEIIQQTLKLIHAELYIVALPPAQSKVFPSKSSA